MRANPVVARLPPTQAPCDPTEAPELATLRTLRRALSRGGLPARRTPADEARLAAFITVQELLRVLDDLRVRLRRGEDVHLRVLEQQSTADHMRVEIVIEPTVRHGGP